MKDTDKTIPFRLSPAELENSRLLRKRMNPSTAIQDDEREAESPGEINAWKSDPTRFNQKMESKNP